MHQRSARDRRTTGTNLGRARARNRRVVLEAIRQAGQLTRAELSRLTLLTAQTISSIASELLDDGLLLTHAPEKIPRGQPPIPLSLNPDGAFSIGFHVSQHRITGVLMDLTGVTRATHSTEVDQPAFSAALPLLSETASALRRHAPDGRLLGVGVGLPGVSGASATDGNRTSAHGWDDPQSPVALEKSVGVPVLIENEATAAAMGERLYGIAATLRDFVYLFVGNGLSAGLYLGNHVYGGHRHRAGELGHMTIAPNGKSCACGNRGCLDRYLSATSLLETLGADARTDVATLDLAGPRYGPDFQRWLAEAAPALRHAVTVVEQLLDPELVVVGSTLPGTVLRPLLEQSFPPLVPSDPHSAAAPEEHVRLGTAGANSVAQGAAAMIILAGLSPDYAPSVS